MRSKLSATGSLKITPTASPILKPSPKPASKSSSHLCTLSLRTVIGTTTSDPNGFSYHESSRTLALCAGSAAVLVELDDELNIHQQFFRARPTATGLNPVPSYYNNTQTPPITPDTRPRVLQVAPRLTGGSIPYASTPSKWGEAASSRTWSSRERIKAVTSVALSPNGRFLAVGESGYNPRVLIFSTANDSPPDIPLSILAEHSFGVQSLSFSPNSQYLASLGDINDGFLFIWMVNLKNGAARLHSANKCTSFIRDMCWLGDTLITVGVRHIKIWRLSDVTPISPPKAKSSLEPANAASAILGPISLPGRNCLLGNLRDSVFTCISPLSEKKAVVCTETGAICFLDDVAGQHKLHFIKCLNIGILSITVDNESNNIFLGCRDGTVQQISIKELTPAVPTEILTSERSQSLRPSSPSTIAMGIISNHIVSVDSTCAIRVYPVSLLAQCQPGVDQQVALPAHKGPVLGIGAVTAPSLYCGAQFYTWSCNGTVSFWDLEGKFYTGNQVEVEQVTGNDEDLNELRVVRTTADMKFFVSGDKFGVIRLITSEPWACKHAARAHAGEVTDIAIQLSQDVSLVATCGRDRMVQVFQYNGESFNLVQTMDEHVGAVGRLLFTHEGEKLLSCSADRTVIIRERKMKAENDTTTVAFLLTRVITLKASPISMTTLSDEPDILVLSTIDRQIHRYDIRSSRHLHSFKAADPETNDTAVISSLAVGSDSPGLNSRLLIGVSTTDKSIRVYDFAKDTLLTREFGHTEGVSDVLLIENGMGESKKRTLVSTGLDGIIMIWDLSTQHQQHLEASLPSVRAEDDTPCKESTAAKAPLRRILSRSELAGFQKFDNPSSPSPTPLWDPSPPLTRRRIARHAQSQSKNGNTISSSTAPTTPLQPSRRSPTLFSDTSTKASRDGSISPSSPKAGSTRTLNIKNSYAKLRRPSMDSRRAKTSGNVSEFGSLNMSTEQICRSLRAYRKKLQGSTDHLHSAPELERELELTFRALGERKKRNQASEDSTDSDNSKLIPPLPSKPIRLARRVPSTPNLTYSRMGDKKPDKMHRTNSLDANSKN
ncbi:hypothetical protein LOZ61_002269 [Ophidiomyces ophidiicola]|uniref:Uncharacterized protein n=1 Tax=Ophidiomyces ophidiicola TaxID=1387563 RepID=A0ACB8UXM3_9EURO|nr:hypothetical protein LOZ61_002269 [Ophidiomyces ophidiicola]KAI1927008.1 hypothetical protein LOZ64_000141 [Ophidiomyces ophidiicola]KAI1929179.1 hypothetical protein LOZ60_001830 [Ophidiomyces ophidiicola]KAI1963602.1 hypothetical protein LOZ59_001802 [Ophidiomyces ophidiicola]KAI1974077.1 hypothetical protein LOZ56_001480 [Ophidiomyces ophidiicola]